MEHYSYDVSKPFIKKIENGHYLGRLMREMYQTFESRTNKQFRIPDEIANVDPEAKAWQANKLTNVFEMLGEYGIALPKQK